VGTDVVTAALPRPRRSLIGKAAAAIAARRTRSGQPGKLAALAAVARQHVVTAAALAAGDFGVFHYGPGPGWIAVCASVLVLDFAVTG
jgi:hypothetical protein